MAGGLLCHLTQRIEVQESWSNVLSALVSVPLTILPRRSCMTASALSQSGSMPCEYVTSNQRMRGRLRVCDSSLERRPKSAATVAPVNRLAARITPANAFIDHLSLISLPLVVWRANSEIGRAHV